MNIVKKLTLRHLKENKSRTVITTLGICVSVAMITAVLVAVASFMNLFGEITIISGGDLHAKFFSVSQQQLHRLEADDRISEIGLFEEPEDGSFRITERKSDRLGTGEILTGNKEYFSHMLTGEYEGSIPENENEIAIEQSLLEKNGLDLEIGDKIRLETGYRYIVEGNEESIVAGSYFYPEEEFRVLKESKEYTITAILHENPATRFTPIFIGMSSDAAPSVINAVIKLSEVNYKSLDELKSIVKEYDIEDYRFNTDYLDTKFAIGENSTLSVSIIPMATVILVIIMIASVLLIYNAFGMSLSERIRYLGMLASVGATKRQKKLSVYYEGFLLGAVGIPLGIASGIIGIGITLKAIGGRIISTGMISGVQDSNMQMKTVVPVWVVIGVVLLSLLTIFVSSLIPSVKASAITPIDAIRQRKEIRIKSKKLKSPKIIRVVFGYEGELAYKNLKRNGRKSRVITVSIALSIVLFLSCNYFCDLFTQTCDMEANVPYQVQANVSYLEKEHFSNELERIDGISNFYTVNNMFYRCGKDNAALNKDFENPEVLTAPYKNFFKSKKCLYANVIEDSDFNKLCDMNGIDSADFYGETVKGLMLNDVTHKGSGSPLFNDKLIGKQIYSMGNDSSDKFLLEIGGLVEYDNDFYVCNLAPKNCLAVYIPESQYFEKMFTEIDTETRVWCAGIVTESSKDVAEKITEAIELNGFNETYVSDIQASVQAVNTIAFVIEVFVYGFICLITLITIANIINTISTNIQLRKKEFAMLKSVGTTPKGFRKMISLESMFYGLRAIVFSVPLSIVISYYQNYQFSAEGLPFIFNWRLYMIVIAVVFVIIGFTMFYAVSQQKKDSIIETLKEEIS